MNTNHIDIKSFGEALETLCYGYGDEIKTSIEGDCIMVEGTNEALHRIEEKYLGKFICDNTMFGGKPDRYGSLMICYYGFENSGNGYLIMPEDKAKQELLVTDVTNEVFSILGVA